MEVFKIPVVALRGLVLLPHSLIHFDINRSISIEAVKAAMLKDQKVLLVTQKDADIDDPELDDLYEIGVIASVKQIVKLPNNISRVMVSTIRRAKLHEFVETTPFLLGEASLIQEEENNQITIGEEKAYLYSFRDLIEVYASVNDRLGKNVVKKLVSIEDINELTDEMASDLPFSHQDKVKLLLTTDPLKRYELLAVLLAQEIEVARIKKEFQGKVKEKVEKNQKEYLLREQLKVIRDELGETNLETEIEQYEQQVEALLASVSVKEKIRKELDRYKSTSSNSAESSVIRGYIETLLSLPWDKVSKDNTDLKNAKKVLDKDHYGLEKVKERVLEFLAVRTLTKKGQSPIICLVGPPGTGKTSIARSVAKALNKEYIRISLGGVRDEAEIRGHRRTYIGAMPGRLVAGLKSAGVKNPLMLLDEIDKVSNDYKGDTFSALLEVLDSEQNSKFMDHYVDLPVDLSQVLFIATANSLQTIPRPLLDRMEIIDVSSYTANEKLHIAKEHLLSKVMERNGITKKQLSISTKAFMIMISGYTREAGVRSLERRIGEICRKVARDVLEEGMIQVKITEKNIAKYLGKQKYTVDMRNNKDEVGIVRGLAWTSVGGDTLQIEVNIVPGKGILELTGQLGDVMKESAKAGISYIRSVSEQYDIPADYFEKRDIHIHIPEGAVPKDGPSAGITMATAVLSAITGKKIRADIAMTGEITLRGRVLPIGGLKEKILAAKTANISQVLVPKQNEKDVTEISNEILDGIRITFVEQMNQVIENAFVR